ncbi:MAG: amidohydrolase family protein [Dehalococcoidia bacterium]
MIVDFHTHIVPPKLKERRDDLIHEDHCLGALFSDPNAKMATAEDLLESMEKDGIDLSVAVNMGWSSMELCRETNDYIMESVARYPDKLVGFGMVDPRWKDAPTEVERCARGGLRGIGELMPHLHGYDLGNRELMEPVVETTTKHDMIILTHSSEPVGHDYPGKGNVHPQMLYSLISSFPDQKFVCAHWGGGLPFYALMPEVGRAFENVWFDTAASPFLYRYDIFPRVAEIIGPEKILFGSDFPLISQGRIIKGLEAKTSVPAKDKELILGRNAILLLGWE